MYYSYIPIFYVSKKVTKYRIFKRGCLGHFYAELFRMTEIKNFSKNVRPPTNQNFDFEKNLYGQVPNSVMEQTYQPEQPYISEFTKNNTS